MIGLEGEGLITPWQHGMQPRSTMTCCHRGFYSEYEIAEDALYLNKMTILDKKSNFLPINGVEPEIKEWDTAEYHLNMLAPFTGSIRLAKDFLNEFYVHMGYQKASAFETVFDITLLDGKIIEVKDRSADAKAKRGFFFRLYNKSETFQAIADALNMDMDIK